MSIPYVYMLLSLSCPRTIFRELLCSFDCTMTSRILLYMWMSKSEDEDHSVLIIFSTPFLIANWGKTATSWKPFLSKVGHNLVYVILKRNVPNERFDTYGNHMAVGQFGRIVDTLKLVKGTNRSFNICICIVILYAFVLNQQTSHG